MTVNVALVTSEALVFGCDSIASTSGWYLDPIRLPWDEDANGQWLRDADGKFSLRFGLTDYQRLVTNAWGGVTKMFEIHPAPSPVVAVTSGLAKLNDRTIASYAKEFLFKCGERKQKLVDTRVIARSFLRFFRHQYDIHYADSKLPEQFRNLSTSLRHRVGADY